MSYILILHSVKLLEMETKECYSRLCEVIPGGVSSPVRACKGLLPAPLIAERGEGAYVFDIEGRKYIDFCGSWGALLHGHAHPVILEAVTHRMRKGTTFGMTTMIEEALAREIIKLMPSIEKIRFVSSGTEATMSALRLARGYTGKRKVIKFIGNYHGHADFLLVKAGSGVTQLPDSSSAGVEKESVSHTLNLPYNDSEVFLKTINDPTVRDDLAAVILEPIAGNMGVVPATHEFLTIIRQETRRLHSLLIMDEVMTGFRVAPGGAQALYNITPDLTCLAKIMGGGFPAAAFGGKAAIMEKLAPLGPVYQAGTLSGNPVAMEGGLTALRLLQQPHFYEDLEAKTRRFTAPIKKALQGKNGCLQEAGSMFTLFFGRTAVHNFDDAKACDLEKFAEFFRFMLSKGIYLPPSAHEAWFVSSAHSEDDMELAKQAALEFIEKAFDTPSPSFN